ncbi:hypothetical protein PVAND_017485 [Polypedilum vanderplanki]|uniref:Uncharacterized protein n=1 Tax=Polypedilum vanderplanki TaxID=319348 RepID=A0A9J6BJN3_POLVA|nr:hypothetical protein PVAND_017485 [Polypedilum vanderplanki]
MKILFCLIFLFFIFQVIESEKVCNICSEFPKDKDQILKIYADTNSDWFNNDCSCRDGTYQLKTGEVAQKTFVCCEKRALRGYFDSFFGIGAGIFTDVLSTITNAVTGVIGNARNATDVVVKNAQNFTNKF